MSQLWLLLCIVTAIGTYKIGLWFLSPFLIDKRDRTTTHNPIRRYPLHQHTSSQSPGGSFPSIRDKATKSISLIFPAFNEAQRLRDCLDPTIEYLHRRGGASRTFSWEIIVVNDGSTDRTAQIVMEYTEKHGIDRVRLLDYTPNQGKGFAVQQVR